MLPDTLQIQDDELPTSHTDPDTGFERFIPRHRRCRTFISAAKVASLLSEAGIQRSPLVEYLTREVYPEIDRGDNPEIQLVWAMGRPL